ncbi:ATP-grasp fold amidoligase family protein [Microbacterium sp. P01]|uniref:ATP-grasp fold amidoligase family protein n=1 Tax=unclassified Microbacterium TaxID=2609290 RepID=UPI00366E3B83
MNEKQVRWRERSRLVRAARLWRTRHPRTFREKVRYKMLRDHRELLVTFADKAAVRQYVAALVGEQYLPVAHAVFDDPGMLDRVELPAAYVVKPTHGSGAALIVSESAPADARLPQDGQSWTYSHVRPEHVTREQIARLSRGWLDQVYGQGPNKEWAYGRVPRGVIIEEMLVGADGGVPADYKFFVFHGACAFVQVDAGRFGTRTQDFFDPQWQHLALSGGPPWADPPPAAPAALAEMLDVAARLGAGTDFVRVDLYDVAGRIVFGELTSYPAGGDSPFHPESFDEEFGRPWVVPRRYR